MMISRKILKPFCKKQEERWRLLSDMPTRRCRAGLAVVQGKVYAVGKMFFFVKLCVEMRNGNEKLFLFDITKSNRWI